MQVLHKSQAQPWGILQKHNMCVHKVNITVVVLSSTSTNTYQSFITFQHCVNQLFPLGYCRKTQGPISMLHPGVYLSWLGFAIGICAVTGSMAIVFCVIRPVIWDCCGIVPQSLDHTSMLKATFIFKEYYRRLVLVHQTCNW